MSLNGLENPAVIEAYQVALNEAGGWFLLHYVSRDEVALFERGTGGVPDVRNAVDGYEEVSPLYGFLQYRRRKVVLSYLPEGLSRLVQARTTVQFQSILDKFSPHDTVFTLSQSSQLTESALSSACLLHTASGSITSSSSSLRRRRLMEIAEDAEENTAARDAAPVQSPVGSTRQRSFSQLSDATIVAPPVPSDAQPPAQGDAPVPAPPALTAAVIPENPPTDDAQPFVSSVAPSVERAPSLRSFREELSHPAPSSESRKSTQSARPSLRDLERTGTYPQKVKRGPRPSVDVNGRPRTAGNLSRSIEQQRPVASLPAGVRSSSLRKTTPPTARPRSQGSTAAAATASSTPGKQAPPVPPLLVPPLSTPISRPQLSPGAKSLSALSSSGTSQEKERLMKALQLRKTQLEKKAQGGGNNRQPPKAVDGERQQRRQEEPPTTSTGENKENQGDKTDGDGKSEEESAAVEMSRSLTPLAEPQPAPIATGPMEQSPGADPAPLTQPNPQSTPAEIKEVVVPHAADEGPSDIPAPSNIVPPTTPPAQRGEISAKEASPEAQTHRQPETDAGEADPALPDAKSGPGSPSAVIDVPPEAASLKAPEEIVASSPPIENPVISAALDDAATGESTASPIPPQSSAIPESPPTTVTASEAPEPQHVLAPEPPIPQQKDPAHRKDKRKPPYLEPIQVPTPDYSDDDNFSDDSFMEELKSATVEEAKPISVGKSPLSPGYSNNGNERTSPDAWRNSRAVSNPSAVVGQTPSSSNLQALAVGRSVSTPFTEMDSATNPVLVAKKINVSSGISKRIKALEKFSNAPSHSTPNLPAAPSASSSFETLRKRASVSLGGHSDSPSRHGSYSPETFSRASSVRRRDSSASSAPRTTNSVSVTARIVRDSSAAPGETNGTPSEAGVLHLQPSQLTVEHEPAEASSPPAAAATATAAAAAPSLTPESTASKSDKRSMSTSSAGSGPRSISPTMQRSESRLSISSASRNDRSDVPSSPEDKRESRTSRLLRRMSSITSNSRKNSAGAVSPVVKEEETAPEAKGPDAPAAVEVPQAVDIGEVNVQFPDTLLWKRRFIRIDDKGFLVLTPGNIDSSNRNMIKRYHLTEFRTPCLPDEDRQELPNSILLDFLDGRTLQCACESRQGQAFVLQTLVGAHTSHQSSMA